MERIGVVSPEQMHAMWQDYLTRQQLAPQVRYNYPQRRPVEDVSPHRVKVKNDSGEVIPAFACMRITGVDDVGGQTCIKVEKPTSTDGEFLFNSQFAIAVPATRELGVGWAYRHGVVTMLGDEPTEPGAAFGPIVGSWEIEEGGDKFVVFGRHDFSERALVGRFAGGSGGAQIIQFRPTDVCEGIGLTCDCVTATVVTSFCGSSIQPGDEVQVWDQSRGWFQIDESLLFNSIGWAIKVKVTEEEQYDLPFDVGPCRWVVQSMDCIEQEPA